MAKKTLFTTEFEIHASPKMLYPYFQTASGLSEWFADNVNISPEKIFTFEWDNEQKKAVITSFRLNQFVKFEYLPESDDDNNDRSYFELRFETDELVNSTYIKISDYSDFDDMEELQDVWESLIANLKKVVGG
jgi:uncharacterized protein YndB with AHSA1/START domain